MAIYRRSIHPRITDPDPTEGGGTCVSDAASQALSLCTALGLDRRLRQRQQLQLVTRRHDGGGAATTGGGAATTAAGGAATTAAGGGATTTAPAAPARARPAPARSRPIPTGDGRRQGQDRRPAVRRHRSGRQVVQRRRRRRPRQGQGRLRHHRPGVDADRRRRQRPARAHEGVRRRATSSWPTASSGATPRRRRPRRTRTRSTPSSTRSWPTPPASRCPTCARWCSASRTQGSFLVGAAAACASKSGKLGFIGGVENDIIKPFEAGFTAGAKQVNPDATVEVKYISQPPDTTGFNDPASGKAIAKAMYDSGIDVVFAAAGGSGKGMFEAVVETGKKPGEVYAIGVDSDQYQTGLARPAAVHPHLVAEAGRRGHLRGDHRRPQRQADR